MLVQLIKKILTFSLLVSVCNNRQIMLVLVRSQTERHFYTRGDKSKLHFGVNKYNFTFILTTVHFVSL